MKDSLKVLVIGLVALLFSGCGAPDLEPVSVGFLRGEYTKSVISEMNEDQFWGSTDAAFSGDAELMSMIQQQAADVFPDGDYVYHRGYESSPVAGYTPHAVLRCAGIKRQVYRKD